MTDSDTGSTRRPGAAALAAAWLGGAVFLASLLYFVYAFLVPFAVPAEGSVLRPAFVDGALFTVFALHHSLLARARAKTWVVSLVPIWFERSLFTWLASVLFLATCLLWQPVPGRAWLLADGWRVLGYAVQAAGLLLTVLGSAAIDQLDLAGIRQVLNARTDRQPRHVPLETGGVYRLVRHPLYLGWALFVFGAPDMTGTRLVFAAVSTSYLILAIPLEERALIAVFGEAYRTYQSRTRWRIAPGIW